MDNISQNQTDNYKLVYSPRTTFNSKKSLENDLFIDLLKSFDPYTLKILRRHFKEHLGSITKDLFICILKRHLVSFNPKVNNRQGIIVKLLSQLFDEIDLDSDNIINWNEFANFLVYIGNSKKNENSVYFLRKYFKCKTIFDHTEKPEIEDAKIKYLNNSEIVSYCFYIQKYRFFGLIHEGKPKIIFFNSETQKRLKLEIDLSLIQEQIERFNKYEFELKTEEKLKKLERKKLIYKQKLKEKYRNLFEKYKQKCEQRTKNNNSFSSDKHNSKDNSQEKNSNPNKSLNNINSKRISSINSVKKEKSKNINLKKILPEEIMEISLNKEMNDKKEKKKFHIVNTLFLDVYNILFISSTNNIITAWKFREKEEYFENSNLICQNIDDPHNKKECIFEKNSILIPLFITEYTQYTMCFDYSANNLYTGQTDGKILKWEMTINKPILILDINNFNKNNILLPKILISNNVYQNEAKDIQLKKGFSELNKILKSYPENKRNTVSCLIYIDPLKILCSTHYNGQIILWDIVSNKPKIIYNDQKTGIYQLLYDCKTNHIYTCGFEHDIFIYDPYVDEEAIYRLKGHKSSVNSIGLIPENNELLSIDILGTVKIWDTINLIDYQTFNINESIILVSNHLRSREELNQKGRKNKLSANIHIQTFPDLNKFLVYGDKFLLYEKGNYINPYLCDDYMILGCFYNPKKNNIITISNKHIKFWNIFNGKLMKFYSDLMDNDNKNSINKIDYEITCYEYDKFYKKLYLGDSLGRIKCFYLSTGDLIKQFEPHKHEISYIIYSNKYDYLITCSIDLKVKFHKDNEQKDNNYKVIREFDLIPEKKRNYSESSKISLKKIVLDEEKCLLISCLSNGLIIELDIEHFKAINEIEIYLDFVQFDNLKNIPLITSAEYIKDANMLFFAFDNKIKELIALKNNIYFNKLKDQYIGQFEEKTDIKINEDNNFKKYIIMHSYYDNNRKNLFLGDSFGYLICYNLSSLFDKLISNELLLKDNIEIIAKKEINFPIIFNIELYKEPITYIFKPEELIPNILIIVSSNRMVSLINYETGKYIDSLKQISILDSPFPIAIKYKIENPFEKNTPSVKAEENKAKEEIDENNEKEKGYSEHDKNENNNLNLMNILNIKDEEEELNYNNIIYRKSVVFEPDPPKIKRFENRQKELIRYSNAIFIYTVKEKLRIPKYEKDIPVDKSTQWYYQIDIENIKKLNEENLSKLIRLVGNKEKEINTAETNFQKYSINSKGYLPKYIKDLEPNEKDKIKDSISRKINDVNLSWNKREKIKKEINEITKTDKNNSNNINNKENIFLNFNKNNEASNIFLTPLKQIKSKSVTNKRKKDDNRRNRLPLIEENLKNKLYLEKNETKNEKNIKTEKDTNTSETHKKLRNNIKIIQSPNRYNFIGNKFKNQVSYKNDKFNEYKNQFDEKYNELIGPIEIIKLKKKKMNYNNL